MRCGTIRPRPSLVTSRLPGRAEGLAEDDAVFARRERPAHSGAGNAPWAITVTPNGKTVCAAS